MANNNGEGKPKKGFFAKLGKKYAKAKESDTGRISRKVGKKVGSAGISIGRIVGEAALSEARKQYEREKERHLQEKLQKSREKEMYKMARSEERIRLHAKLGKEAARREVASQPVQTGPRRIQGLVADTDLGFDSLAPITVSPQKQGKRKRKKQAKKGKRRYYYPPPPPPYYRGYYPY